ncbi:MAG: hypothetical protein C3F18_00085 [Nitrosomonadales bacterium]|nr:MAG: hypothetical protein C3F18_00085 [Nitrosomonadales bacterium]
MKSVVLCLTAVAFLGGCATAGNEKMKDQNQSSMQQKITEGKTTKAEVQAAMGDANTVSFTDSGNEIWTYKYSRATPQLQSFIPIVNLFSRGADVNTKELVVLFDKNNVVSKYTMRETNDVVKSGIAQ